MKNIVRFLSSILYELRTIFWFIFRPISFGVKVVLIHDNKLLLVKHSYIFKGMWTFPGGKVEKGEDKIKAAKREILEELGIDLNDIFYIDSFVSTKEYRKDNISIFASAINNLDVKKNDFEIKETKWFSLNEIPPLGPVAKNILNLCQQNIEFRKLLKS